MKLTLFMDVCDFFCLSAKNMTICLSMFLYGLFSHIFVYYYGNKDCSMLSCVFNIDNTVWYERVRKTETHGAGSSRT